MNSDVVILARIFHESLAATTDMAVLPGVLGCRLLRRTVQVRLGPIPRYRGTVARWHAHLRGLATEIHEISGLVAVRRESVLLVWADWSYFVYLGVFDNFPKTVRLDVDPWTTVSDRTRIVGRIVLAQSRFSGIDPTQLGVG